MERQHGGRVSVSVFPTFQSDVEIAKVENVGSGGGGAQPPPAVTTPVSTLATAVTQSATDNTNRLISNLSPEGVIPEVRMVMKQHNGHYEGAPPYPNHPSSRVSNHTVEMGNMEKPSLQKMIVNFCSEVAGTYILVFLGCMGCVAGMSGGSVPHLQISFIFGFAVLIAVQCFGHISGGHINPIVTIASVILGNTPIAMAPVYILGQFVGAIAGYGSVMLVTPSVHLGNTPVAGVKGLGVCSPALNPQLSPIQGLAVEFIASSFLILVCCAVWDRLNADKHDSVSVRFGLTIAVLAMAAGPYSGANMNPARSFAPALLNGDWAHHWIYWVGPLLAAVLPTWAYKYLFNTPPPQEKLPETIPLN